MAPFVPPGAPASRPASRVGTRTPARAAPGVRPDVVRPGAGRPDPAQRDGQRPGQHGPGRLLTRLLFPVADAVALVVAVAIADCGLPRGAAYAATVLVALAVAGLYGSRISPQASDRAGQLVLAVAGPAAILLFWTSPGQAARLAAIATALVLGLRVLATAGLRAAWRRGLLARRTLIVGTDTGARKLAARLRAHPGIGLAPCGMLDNFMSAGDAASLPVPLLGTVADATQVASRFGVSRVLVCFPSASDSDLLAMVRACRSAGAAVSILPRLAEVGAAIPRGCLDEIWGMPFIGVRPDPRTVSRRVAKRLLDVALASALLVLTAPVMLVLAVAVRLDLGLPPLFRQARIVGRGRQATITKLRTLRPAGDPDTTWVIPAAQSSRLGKLLRGTHADELPQLAGVVRGELSLVGPRPERPYFARQLASDIGGYADRERVSAGLTGWAQVHGLTGDTSIEDRARFDNFYIEYWSVWLDLLILARTLPSAVCGALKSARGGTA